MGPLNVGGKASKQDLTIFHVLFTIKTEKIQPGKHFTLGNYNSGYRLFKFFQL